MKPNQEVITMKPNPNIETTVEAKARPLPNPETKNENQTPHYNKYENKLETTKPDIEPDSEPKPELTKKKPPKLKTKVVQAGDLKLFLASKKRERDLKLKCLGGSEKDILINTPSDHCSATLHPVQPIPLLHSASGAPDDNPALHRTIESGNNGLSANPSGTTNLCGELLLADNCKNLG